METNPDCIYCEAKVQIIYLKEISLQPKEILRDVCFLFLSQNGCANKPCKNKATCQTGFTGKGYRCLCPAEFDGDHCENGKLLKIMDNFDSPPFFQVSCKIRWNYAQNNLRKLRLKGMT